MANNFYKKVGGFLKETWNNLTGKTANDIASQGVEASKQGVEATYKANAENIASQEKINAENVALQERLNKQNIDWARELNNIEMARADSAHQREVADMRKAGLSPFASMNGADVGTLTAPTLGAPTLNAPLNDVGAIGTSIGNLASAIGNQAQVMNTTRGQTIDYALGMLNFVKGEQSLKHQKDYDNEMVEITKDKLKMEMVNSDYENQYKSILGERAKVENQVNLSKDEREKELHAFDVRIAALEESKKAFENESILISNKRSQLSYQSEQKDYAYKDQLLEVQLNKERQECALIISQTHNNGIQYAMDLIRKENIKKEGDLTDKKIEQIVQSMGLEPKRYKLSVWRTVLSSIFGLKYNAREDAKTIMSVIPGVGEDVNLYGGL